jgi:predicted ATP-binding protein involved in virulence
MELKELHEEVFKFLLEKRKADPSLRYTLRSNDTDGMLQKGYWFLGDKNSLYISFWDIISLRKPDICFEIQKDETCLLTVHFYLEEADYWNGLVRILGLKSKGGNKKSGITYEKIYTGNDFKKHLEDFILTERPFINSSFKLSSAKEVYPPISESDFLAQLNKIKNIRKGHIEVKFDEFIKNKLQVTALHLTNINVFKSLNLSFDKRITCFVGNNGSGKTTILRSIALGLVGASDFKKDDINLLTIKEAKKKTIYYPKGNITVFYSVNQKKQDNEVNFTQLDSGRTFKVNGGNGILKEDNFLEALVVGFAQQTLSHTHGKNPEYSPNIKDVKPLILNKSENRFEEFLDWLDYLLDADTQKDRQNNKILIKNIFEVVRNITGDAIELTSDSDIFFKTKTNEAGLPARLLSQGYKNVLTWVGIFMKRLWEYKQSLSVLDETEDLIDFQQMPAVCLIDEIDTYLHPNWQYTVLQGLVESFPNVQFFITSHSPFALTSVPSSKLAIYELVTEKGEVFALNRTENLYGADANRSTKEISTERMPEIQKILAEINANIENNELETAENVLNALEMDKNDIAFVLAKRKIQVKRLSSKPKHS